MSSTDREALVALYISTGGACWTCNDRWGSDVSLSAWYGVQVNDQGRVVKLSLTNNNLTGFIPKEVGALSELEVLWLDNNALAGHIPGEIGDFAAFMELWLNSKWLNSNQLSGHIPEEVGDFAAFMELWLNSNQLSGAIPPVLGALAALPLSANGLPGHIPEEVGDFAAFMELWLNSNQLSGAIPPVLGALAALPLSANGLPGPIPTELGEFRMLRHLYLCRNQRSGNVPPSLGQLTKVGWLSHCENDNISAMKDIESRIAAVKEKRKMAGPDRLARDTTLSVLKMAASVLMIGDVVWEWGIFLIMAVGVVMGARMPLGLTILAMVKVLTISMHLTTTSVMSLVDVFAASRETEKTRESLTNQTASTGEPEALLSEPMAPMDPLASLSEPMAPMVDALIHSFKNILRLQEARLKELRTTADKGDKVLQHRSSSFYMHRAAQLAYRKGSANRKGSATRSSTMLGVLAATIIMPGVAASEPCPGIDGGMTDFVTSARERWCNMHVALHVVATILTGICLFKSVIFAIGEIKAGWAELSEALQEARQAKHAAARTQSRTAPCARLQSVKYMN